MKMTCHESELTNQTETTTSKNGDINAPHNIMEESNVVMPPAELSAKCGGSSATVFTTEATAVLTLIASTHKEEAQSEERNVQTQVEAERRATRLPRLAVKVHQTGSDMSTNSVSAGPVKLETPMGLSQPTSTAVETIKPFTEDRAEVEKPKTTNIKAPSELPKPSANAGKVYKPSDDRATTFKEQVGATNTKVVPTKVPIKCLEVNAQPLNELTAEAEEQAAITNIKAPSKLPRPAANAPNTFKLSDNDTAKVEEQAGIANNKATSRIPKPGVNGAKTDKFLTEEIPKVEDQSKINEIKASAEVLKPTLDSPKLHKVSNEKITEVEKSKTPSRIPKFGVSSVKAVKTSTEEVSELKGETETVSPQSTHISIPPISTETAEKLEAEKPKTPSRIPKFGVKVVKTSIEGVGELKGETETVSPQSTHISTPIKPQFTSKIARFPISSPKLAQPYSTMVGVLKSQDSNIYFAQHPGSKIPTKTYPTALDIALNSTTPSKLKTLPRSSIPTKVEIKNKNEMKGLSEELDVSIFN